MREALVQCELFLGNVSRHGHPTLNPGDKCTACDGVDELRGMVVRALAVPPRNCDEGTAEEQARRYKLFCENHSGWDGQKRFGCLNCPFIDEDECEFAWAQMPYTAKEGED